MKKRIAIVANYNKTLFFKEIANKLEASQQGNGIEVFWICVSAIWYKHLIQAGVKAEHILYLPRSIAHSTTHSTKEESALSNSNVSHHYQLNELIYSDRVFRHEPEFGEHYLLAMQPLVRSFIQTHQISHVFGEITWAHEALINRMCLQENDLNCRFLKPHTIRIPNQRFAFFTDEYESSIYPVNGGIEKEWEFELKKPDYFHLNDQKNKLSTRLTSLFGKVLLALSPEKHDREDPTQRLSRIRFFSTKLLGEINYYIYKFFVKTRTLDNLPERFWVYYLHKQPEASIDIVGRYFEDQTANILRLARMIPDDCYLLVKEHSNAIGDRPYSFYKNIKALNRVDLIDEKADSFTLIERAEKTVTVSGTVAYEAGLLNKPALLLSRVFFAALPSITTIGTENKEKTNIQAFKKYLYKNSFSGVISDPLSDARCMAAENIEQVSHAFLQVIHHA